MNTHDKIELPPLPTIDVMGKKSPQIWFTAAEVDALRRAAIETDRKRRSEPVELQGVAEAISNGDGFWRSCTGCHETNEGYDTGLYSKTLGCHLGNGCRECGGVGAVWDDTDYDAMADYMARGMGSQQPAEPLKSYLTVKYDDKGDCLYVCCDSNEPAEAEENEQGVLLRRAFSDGRLVGVTILNFMGRYAEPVKIDVDALAQERADFEAWYGPDSTTDVTLGRGEWSEGKCAAWAAWQAALQSQTVIDDDHLSIVLDVYDNAMQKAFEGWEFPNPCEPGTPEHKAWEKGSKEGKKKRDAGLPNSIALQSQDMSAEVTKRPISNETKTRINRNIALIKRLIGNGASKTLRNEADAVVSQLERLKEHGTSCAYTLQSQDREDGERLDWLLRHLPGNAIRYCVGVIADTSDIDEFRTAIDHARRVEGDGV